MDVNAGTVETFYMQSTPTGKQASKALGCMQSTQIDSSCMHAKQGPSSMQARLLACVPTTMPCMPRIHRHLRAAYNHLLGYSMAANSKVIYNTTKLFLCVCMNAATRRCWIPWVLSWTASKTTRWQSNHERYYVLLYTVIRLANLNLALLRNAVIIFTELVCFSYTYC